MEVAGGVVDETAYIPSQWTTVDATAPQRVVFRGFLRVKCTLCTFRPFGVKVHMYDIHDILLGGIEEVRRPNGVKNDEWAPLKVAAAGAGGQFGALHLPSLPVEQRAAADALAVADHRRGLYATLSTFTGLLLRNASPHTDLGVLVAKHLLGALKPCTGRLRRRRRRRRRFVRASCGVCGRCREGGKLFVRRFDTHLKMFTYRTRNSGIYRPGSEISAVDPVHYSLRPLESSYDPPAPSHQRNPATTSV